MKCLITFLLLAVTAILFTCSSKPTYPVVDTFPLEVGNSWEYSHTHKVMNFRPLNKPTDTFTDIFQINQYEVSAVHTEVLENNIEVVVLQSDQFDGIGTNEMAIVKYEQRADGLYEWKSGPLGFRFLKSSLLPKFSETAPRRLLAFPLTIGYEWETNENTENTTFNVVRKVEGIEDINTGFGVQTCYRITTRIINNDGTWLESFTVVDWINENGLIKRYELHKDIGYTTHEYPDGYGIVDYEDITILTKFNLN